MLEELKVFDKDPFDEEDAIFYLGFQSTRQRVVRVGPETKKRYNDRSESIVHWRNPLLAGNIPETRFSQEKYIQYKITKIVHIVEVKKHIMSAVLFFKKKF